MWTDRSRRLLFYTGAFLILLFALSLRIYGHDWDDGWYLQPDERNIVMVLTDRIHAPRLNDLGALLDPAHSPLNPRSDGDNGNPQSYAYGSLPLYVTDFVAWAVGVVTHTNQNNYDHVGMIGRYLTAILDAATVALAMIFARRAFGRLAALLAGFLLAATVLMVQLAHFFAVDPWVTFFSTALLVACLGLYQRPGYRWSVAAGICFGLALATKISVFELAVPIIVTIIAAFRGRSFPEILNPLVKHLAAASVSTLVTFALFEPYALLQRSAFISDTKLQWHIVNGSFDVPFTRQFVGDIPVRYELGNLVHWGLGPALGITALLAVGATIWRIRHRTFAELLLLSWIVPYFALVATAEAKFMRYLLPIVPALVILTIAFVLRLVPDRPARTIRFIAPVAGIALILIGTLGWSLAFESIYHRTYTRISASEWIFQNIPQGSKITDEYWDVALPLPLEGHPYPTPYFSYVTMDLYADRSNADEFTYIANALHQADYIILSSDRLALSIPKSPWRYPVDAEYYHLLTSGQLGFQEVYESNVEPSLLGITFNDHHADESFSVYDHPHVRIYKKVSSLTTDELRQRFAASIAQPWSPTRTSPSSTLMLNVPVDQRPVANDLGWSGSITHYSLAATAFWLILLVLLGLATLPLTLALFGRFSDLGWGFARLVGLIVTGYAVWICVSLQLVHFRVPNILVPISIVVLVIWVGFRKQVRQSWTVLRERRRMILATEFVFFGAFAFFLLLRAMNPDLWQTYFGGEKPMEMAYMNAIGRSAVFPPYDPWFAGGAMNYYYYGFYLISYLWKLTGVPPEIGFQLGMATISAMLLAGVFSLSSTIGSDLLRTTRLKWIIIAGGCGVLLHSLIGNLDGFIQVVTSNGQSFDFWRSRSVVTYAITEFPYFTNIWADLHPHAIDLPITVLLIALVYQRIRDGLECVRAVAVWSVVAALVLGTMVVTNSWDMPLGLLLVGAALLTTALARRPYQIRRFGLVIGIWLAIGGMTYAFFWPFFSRFVALVSGIARTSNGTAPSEYLVQFGIFLGILAATGVVLAIGRFTPKRYHCYSALVAAGSSAIASLIYNFIWGDLAFKPATETALLSALAGAVLPLFVAVIVEESSRWQSFIFLSPVLAVGVGFLMPIRPTAALLLVPLVVGMLVWLSHSDQKPLVFIGLLVAAASGVTLGTDIVFVIDDLSNSPWERMNTVFKFFLEGWTLFALAAAAALLWLIYFVATTVDRQSPVLIAGTINRQRAAPGVCAPTASRVTAARLALLISLALVAAGLVYPFAGTPARLSNHMPGSPTSLTLNGFAWMDGSSIMSANGLSIDFTGDYAAITWLREHDKNNGVIAEASIGPYRGDGSRISSGTGIPTILGWDSHQRQQRYWPGIDQRLAEIWTLYNSTDVSEKRQLLEEYSVRYIIIGDVERNWVPDAGFAGKADGRSPYASAAGLAAFNLMVGSDLQVEFRSGDTIVYEVIPFPELPQALTEKVGM
jgi:YYY domain-containing protein